MGSVTIEDGFLWRMMRVLRRNCGQQVDGLRGPGGFVLLREELAELFAAHLSGVFGETRPPD